MADNRKAVIDIEINGIKAGDTIKSLNAQLSAARKELNSLPIGTKEWAAALDNVNQKAAALDGVKLRMAETAKASSQLRAEIQSQIPLFGQFQGLSDKLTLVRTATTGSITAMNLLKIAMAAIPIFALIAAFASLITWFKKTDDGARTLDGIIKAVSNSFEVLLNRVLNIGDTLKQLFTNPVDFFKNFASDIMDATKAGQEFANMTDDIDEKQRNLDLANSEREKQITNLILQSKNRTLTEKQRIELLEQASALEKKSLDETIALQDQKIKLAQLEADQYAKNYGRNDELERKLIDAKIERNRLEQDSLNLQEKIKNREDALLDASGKKQEAANAKRQKDAAAAAKDLADLEKYIQDTRIGLISDAQAKEMAILDAKFEEEYTKYGDNQNALNLLNEKYKQDKLAIDKKYHDLETKQTLADAQLGYDLLTEQTKTNFLSGQLTEAQYQETLYQMRLGYETKKLDLLRSSGTASALEIQQQQNVILGIQAEKAKQEIELNKAKNQKKLESYRATAQATGSIIGSLGQFTTTMLSLQGKNSAEAAAAQKAITLVNLGVNSAQAISAATASGASLPYPANIAAIVSGVATVLANIAQAGALLSESNEPQPANIQSAPSSPGFVEGGYTPKASKYTPVGVVHGGEWVAPAWMVNSPNFSGAISMLESSRKQGFATGGPVPSTQTTNVSFPSEMRLAKDDLDYLANSLVESIKSIPVELPLNKLETAQNERDIVIKSAKFA